MTTTTENQTRGFFGHPRGLANLFGTEMWERFSFYGMQAILLYYLTYTVAEGGLAIDEGTASGIVGAYGGSVYLATIGGSWIADRVFGPERTLFYSGCLILGGHVSLAVIPDEPGLVLGLVLVAIGSGGLKATATALVGTLYSEGDERRDAGFSIFYMGVNLGALVGPIVTGILQDRIGFHWGFGAAAVGMALGLAQYSMGRRHLPEQGRVVPNPLDNAGRIRAVAVTVGVLAVVAILLGTGLVHVENLDYAIAIIILIASVSLFTVITASRRITATERSRVLAFIPMFVVSFGFWALFQQQFTVIAQYADVRIDKHVFGFDIPAAWFESIEPLFVVLLAPVFAALWIRLGPRQPSSPVKFGLGVVGMGIAFLFMALMGQIRGEAVVHPLLLTGVLIVFVMAEMCLSPVGLSLSTKLAPQAFETQMVALNFLSVALGTTVAGSLAEFYHVDQNEFTYFGIIGLAAIALGVVQFALTTPIQRLMAGIR